MNLSRYSLDAKVLGKERSSTYIYCLDGLVVEKDEVEMALELCHRAVWFEEASSVFPIQNDSCRFFASQRLIGRLMAAHAEAHVRFVYVWSSIHAAAEKAVAIEQAQMQVGAIRGTQDWSAVHPRHRAARKECKWKFQGVAWKESLVLVHANAPTPLWPSLSGEPSSISTPSLGDGNSIPALEGQRCHSGHIRPSVVEAQRHAVFSPPTCMPCFLSPSRH